MSVEAWQGGHSGVPKFGRKAQAWLRRRIKAHLFPDVDTVTGDSEMGPDGAKWDRKVIDWLLDEYAARAPGRFVHWVDADEWRGRGFSNGSWQFDAKAVEAFCQEAIDNVDRRLDANAYPTLDEWLKADMADDLWFRGAAGGMDLLSAEVRASIAAGKAERAARRHCACGVVFVAERSNARKCAGCRATARAEQKARAKSQAVPRRER
jgi:hypothetical protein